ncbi:MAG TPA: hypothetical protein VML94_04705 [Thermoplasmata archaeon]|nr:hypothetical protein [Thermoplasmata archaeon]
MQDLSQLPTGAHCLDLFSSEDEAAEHATAFLAGALDPDASSYWVAGNSLLAYCQEKASERDPSLSDRFHVLDGPQVLPTHGKLRPAPEVVRFLKAHPDGVTAAAATITEYWTREQIPGYIEYERWFDEQERSSSRFLCPYDLRKVPTDLAASVLPQLIASHSHVALSKYPNPASQMLQLLIFPQRDLVPSEFRPLLDWGLTERNLLWKATDDGLELTAQGEHFARALRSFPPPSARTS